MEENTGKSRADGKAAGTILLTSLVRTVETHRANFMGKLGLSNRAEIVRWAAEHGLRD